MRALLTASAGLAFAGLLSVAAVAQTDGAVPDAGVDPDLIPEVDVAPVVAFVGVDGHRAVAGCLAGLTRELPDYGYFPGENLELVEFIAAQDGADLDAKIGEAVALEPAAIVPVSAGVAAGVAAVSQDTPIVFCAVADPIEAGLLTDTMRPGGNATGVSDSTPVSELLALVREVLPEEQILGVIYDEGNESSARLIGRLSQFAPGAGFRTSFATVSDPSQIEEAMRGLVEEADVVLVPADPAVVPALDDAIRVAEESRTPLFVTDPELVRRGALGSRGVDYNSVGASTAGLLARVLDGENPGVIPVINVEDTYLIVNVHAAERMGVQLAPGFMARAGDIVEDEAGADAEAEVNGEAPAPGQAPAP